MADTKNTLVHALLAALQQVEAESDALRADAGRWALLLHAAGRVLQAVDDGYLQPDPETLQGGIVIDALREAWGAFAPARIKGGGNG